MQLPDEPENGRFAQLFHYLSDELDPADRAAVEAWLAEAPEGPVMLGQVQRVLDEASVAIAQSEVGLKVDVEAVLERFLAERRVGGRVGRAVPKATPFAARWVASPALKIAAGLVLLIGGAALYRQMGGGHPRPLADAPTAMRTFTTQRGERGQFRLRDGTTVVLGAASTLRVPGDYGVKARRLFLDGEAYFDVVHDSASRFLVLTSNAITEDLGTRFNVRAYSEDQGTQVVVAEGSVAVQARGSAATSKNWILRRGQSAHIALSGAITTNVDADLAPLGWIDGKLAFDNTALGDAVGRLERWYDIDIRLADSSLATRRFSATFRTESLPDVVRLLSLSLDLRVEQTGKTIVLHDAATPRRGR